MFCRCDNHGELGGSRSSGADRRLVPAPGLPDCWARLAWILMVQVDRSPAQMVIKRYPPQFKVDVGDG